MRALERGGGCAAVACAFAALWTAAAMWSGRDALQLAVTIIALAAAAGVAWGLICRPSMLQAAVEADRQLDLDDLLGTALAARDGADADAWARTVLAIADARCRALSPARVVLNRYGARAWGGIGLAVAFVLTLGVLSTSPTRSDANLPDSAGEGSARSAAAAEVRDSTMASRDPSEGSRVEAPRAAEDRAIIDLRVSEQQREKARNNPQVARSGSDAASDMVSQRSNSVGARSSSDDAAGDPERLNAVGAGGLTPDGELTAGGGETANTPATDGASLEGGGMTAGRALGSRGASAPWASPSWSARRDAALRAVGDGRVPDGYRDVVREYFRRDQE